MAGLGIGLGLGLGGGGGGALTEAAVMRALTAGGLSDAQARAAIGSAASLPAGLRVVGLMPAATPTFTPTPSITPLPAGIVAMWNAASLSGLADGAAVTTWTDATGGSVATQTDDSGAPHTYVADSGGGVPAVRLSGAAVLATAGSNAAATAMAGGERGMIVVARKFQGAGAGQVNPTLVASGGGTNLMFQATSTQTGRYGAMYDCGDAGVRTIGYGGSTARTYGIDGINGSAIFAGDSTGGQITIGGWQNAGTRCCGRADVLAIIVFNRAVTAADFKQVHRRYCELLGQSRPGGASARNLTFIGDSLTAGYPVGYGGSYPFQMAAALGLPWGTWDQMGVPGFTWYDMRDRTLPMLGDVSAATGVRSIVCAWEWANMRGSAGTDVAGAAQAVIDALHAQDANREVIFGTSIDDGSSAGVNTRQHRADYNAYWDNAAHRTGVAAYVQLHLDPNVGVQGSAPTDGNAGTYYQADNLHLTAAGYALVDAGSHGFRAAVQARLAA